MKLIVCFTLKLSVCFWGLGDLGFRVSLFVLLPRHRCWWRCCCCWCFCSPWERAGIVLPPIAFVAGHQKRAVAISGLSYIFFNVFVRFCLYLFVLVFFTTKTNRQTKPKHLQMMCLFELVSHRIFHLQMLCLLQLVSDRIVICKRSVCLSLFLIEFSSANALVCFSFFLIECASANSLSASWEWDLVHPNWFVSLSRVTFYSRVTLELSSANALSASWECDLDYFNQGLHCSVGLHFVKV